MKYPIGIQTFADVINGGYAYVDKTAHVWALANEGKYYFLSRPRRFGKSLLISTFEAYFRGQRELFRGLAIEQLEQDWTPHHVLRLDFAQGDYTKPNELECVLHGIISRWEKIYGADKEEQKLGMRFAGVVRRAYERDQRGVVILIDEDDRPLLDAIDHPELMERNRTTLKSVYSVMKSEDQYIRFAFATGVTKFSQVTIFSGLNNISDISMVERYADICGITEQELRSTFAEGIEELAAATHQTAEETLAQLKEWYDGYHFRHDTPGMYNPWSIINALRWKAIDNYWTRTGMPTILYKVLRDTHYDLRKLQGGIVTPDLIGSVDSIKASPLPLLFQSGYLTVQSYDPRRRAYRMDFPNKEVEESFTTFLAQKFMASKHGCCEFDVWGFIDDVEAGEAEQFMLRLKTLFADADYRVVGDAELYFQNCVYLVFKMMGFYVEVERASSRGRSDVEVRTDQYIFIMELKVDDTPQAAMQQIEQRGYAERYAMDTRTLIRIGAQFSSTERTFTDWIIR